MLTNALSQTIGNDHAPFVGHCPAPLAARWDEALGAGTNGRLALRHTGRVVLAALEGHELVDRVTRRGVAGADVQLRSTWQIARLVGDERPTFRHDLRARHLTQVDQGGRREVARLEGTGDLAHVRTNARNTGGVVDVSLELDPAAVWESVEVVRGRILVDTHCHPPPLLHRGKGTVVFGGRRLLAAEGNREKEYCEDADGEAIHDERSA